MIIAIVTQFDFSKIVLFTKIDHAYESKTNIHRSILRDTVNLQCPFVPSKLLIIMQLCGNLDYNK